ncbi:MAG: GNAT family N-acetyltransferase [Nocardioides sp.]|jgi:GNAT superfamily N-acetyltransferase
MTIPTPHWEIRPVSIEHPDAQMLIEQVQSYYVSLYGSRDETPLEPGYFEPPQGAFFVGYLHGEPVASGAWRMRPDVAALLGLERPVEIKRMYVVSRHQRQGLAGRMLAHLEQTAWAAGATDVILESGAPQAAALHFYEQSGYRPIQPFAHYRDSPLNRCLARSLGGG